MINSLTSEDLVKACLDGDESAWNNLHKQYFPVAYAAALGICGNTPVAKDVVQDAFIVAFLKLPQLKDTNAFGSWIKKIVERNCYRVLKNNSSVDAVRRLTPQSDKYWEDEVNKKYEDISRKCRLYDILSKLPEHLRTTIILRYLSGFNSYEQIAMILGVPIGTIRSRLNQAKTKMGELWKKFEEPRMNIFIESEEWNLFYFDVYAELHQNDSQKNKFLNHLQNDIQLVFSNGLVQVGSRFIDQLVANDRIVGSCFKPANVQTCGNISIVEARHFNSPEHPNHCPESTVFVLYRKKGRVEKMNLHTALPQK